MGAGTGESVGLEAWEIAEQVNSGRRRASDVVEEHLQRIEARNSNTDAFVHLDRDRALCSARRVDETVRHGENAGPLAGVPLAVKELQPVAGWPFSSGSSYFADRVAQRTSTMVERAEQAGAILVGSTASPEFGRASFTATRLHGVCRNPWDLTRTPGGSSGGAAAAVADYLVPLATGGDGAGSIRIPASFCGVVGLKGTYGRVTRGPGGLNAATNTVNGVLSRSVRDTARFLDCVVGLDERDAATLPAPGFRYEDVINQLDTRGLRAVWSSDLGGYAPSMPEVVDVARSAAETLVSLTNGTLTAWQTELGDPDFVFERMAAIDTRHSLRGAAYGRVDDIDPTVRRYVQPELTVDELLEAHERRAELCALVADVFDDVDYIMTPATQTTAFAAAGPMPTEIAGHQVSWINSIGITYLFNITGHPAISIPAGLVDGLPVGLQIVARRHHDAELLALAALLERRQPWPMPR